MQEAINRGKKSDSDSNYLPGLKYPYALVSFNIPDMRQESPLTPTPQPTLESELKTRLPCLPAV